MVYWKGESWHLRLRGKRRGLMPGVVDAGQCHVLPEIHQRGGRPAVRRSHRRPEVIAGGRQHIDHAQVQLNDSNVKGAASGRYTRTRTFIRVNPIAIGQGSGGSLVDDAFDLQAVIAPASIVAAALH